MTTWVLFLIMYGRAMDVHLRFEKLQDCQEAAQRFTEAYGYGYSTFKAACVPVDGVRR